MLALLRFAGCSVWFVIDFAESIRAAATATGFAGVVRTDDGNDTQMFEAFGTAHRGFGLPNTIDILRVVTSHAPRSADKGEGNK